VNLRRNRRRLAAVLTGASAAIHLTASVAHWQEWWVFAVVFALTALLQLIWSVRVWEHDGALLIGAGLALNLAITVVWALSRTRGLPFGPDAHIPEALGVPDLQATIDELLACIVLLTAVALPIRRALLRLSYGFEALGLGMLVTSFVLLASGAGHPS